MTGSDVQRGEKTQKEILDVAYRLFIKNGYHGSSMRLIAQEASIALGGIYNHFSGKEEIFKEVLYAYHPFNSVLPAMQAAEGKTVEEFIYDAAHKMVASLQGRYDFLNLLFVELVEFRAEHVPELFQHFFPQVLQFGKRFAEGKDELRPISIMVLVRVFVGLFFSYVMTEILIGDQFPQELEQNQLNNFVDIYLHGILADSKKDVA
jgi:AcrR family transcriptional regulator